MKKYTEEELKQIFKNRSNCYADSYEVIMAMDEEQFINVLKELKILPIQRVSNRIFTVVDQDGDLINCWKNKEDAEKYAEELRKEHGTYFEATEQPLF